MNIITRMIKKYDINNFIFAGYDALHCETVSLLLKTNHQTFFDIRNKKYIYKGSIKYIKPLSDYVSIAKNNITINDAEEISLMFYKAFMDEYRRFFRKPKQAWYSYVLKKCKNVR